MSHSKGTIFANFHPSFRRRPLGSHHHLGRCLFSQGKLPLCFVFLLIIVIDLQHRQQSQT